MSLLEQAPFSPNNNIANNHLESSFEQVTLPQKLSHYSNLGLQIFIQAFTDHPEKEIFQYGFKFLKNPSEKVELINNCFTALMMRGKAIPAELTNAAKEMELTGERAPERALFNPCGRAKMYSYLYLSALLNIKDDQELFKKIPKDLQDDEEVATAAIQLDPMIYSLVSPGLKKSIPLAQIALQRIPAFTFPLLDEELRDDQALVMQAFKTPVSKWPDLKLVGPSMKKSIPFALHVLKHCPKEFKHFDPQLLHHPAIVQEIDRQAAHHEADDSPTTNILCFPSFK